MREIVGIVFMIIALVAMAFFLVMLIRRALGAMNGSCDPSSDASMLRYVEHCLSFSCILLGYTALKWLCIATDYAANGVQAEANIYALFLVIPFGLVFWVVGIVEEILAIVKICRKDFPRQKLKTASKVILVVNLVLVCLSTAELVVIFAIA